MNTSKPSIISTGIIMLFSLVAFKNIAKSTFVSGTTTGSYSKQQKVAIPHADGQALMLNEYKGSNKNTSGSDYMDGASVTNEEIGQLFQGNGEHAGYFTLIKNKDSTVAKWNGHVTTTIKKQQPIDHFRRQMGVCKWNRKIPKY